MLMAKAAYADRFIDLTVSDWVLAFYKRTYLVDDRQAGLLRGAQWLDWTVESAF